MGGCRCTFRGCPNNSANSPGMHFFHYPFKKPERFKLWVKYADTKEFINMPDSKAKNKVVCETHFRDECFMNYKKERLVHFAIPTLVRLSNGKVLDFEISDNPKPQHLEPPNGKHLIKPTTVGNQSGSTSSSSSSGCAVEKNSSDNSLSMDESFVIETVEDYHQPLTVKSPISVKRSYGGSIGNVRKESSIKRLCTVTKLANDNQPRILNAYVGVLQSTASGGGNKKTKQKEILNLEPIKTLIASTTTTTTTVTATATASTATSYEESVIPKEEIIFSNEINLDPIEENLEENQHIVNISFECPTDQDNNEIIPMEMNEDEDENNEFKEMKEPEDDKINKSVLDQIVTGYEEQIKLLKEELEMKTTEVEAAAAAIVTATSAAEKTKCTTQVETVSTSRQPKVFGGSLTKAQLFNGIKKYLCPSMAALVRMEMFGGPERQWKSDEKQVSVELLKLGGTVFNYFRDEWRFRLPPKKDVEQWLSECNNIEDEDEDI